VNIINDRCNKYTSSNVALWWTSTPRLGGSFEPPGYGPAMIIGTCTCCFELQSTTMIVRFTTFHLHEFIIIIATPICVRSHLRRNNAFFSLVKELTRLSTGPQPIINIARFRIIICSEGVRRCAHINFNNLKMIYFVITHHETVSLRSLYQMISLPRPDRRD
jgi:hypothetical protein